MHCANIVTVQITAILKALIEKQFNTNHQLIENSVTVNDGLFTGTLGVALYYINLYKAFGKQEYALMAIQHTEVVLANINSNKQLLHGTSLCNGTCGLAYLLTQLNELQLIDAEALQLIAELDNTLYYVAKELLTIHNNDLLHGAMGIVFYYLQKIPNTIIYNYCYRLLTLFCNNAVYTNNGIWFKNLVIAYDKETDINLSLSHGQSGFLVILAMAYNKGVKLTIIPTLLQQGINFILQYRQQPCEANYNSHFPSIIQANKCQYTQRLAWCYGDLNVVLAILEANKITNNKNEINLANDIGIATISRSTLLGVAATDSHICHGTTGLALQYYKLYQLTTIKAYHTAWVHWLQLTAKELLPQELNTKCYSNKATSILEGLVGVNLTYLTYLYPRQVNWNTILLL